ncbi:MAG: hypothetical protein AB2556_24100 [Candidatus Thiodiazotropha sp.]
MAVQATFQSMGLQSEKAVATHNRDRERQREQGPRGELLPVALFL